jgi:hypothetical protein
MNIMGIIDVINKAALHNYGVTHYTKEGYGEIIHILEITDDNKTIKTFKGFEVKDITTEAIEWLRFITLKKIT